MSANIDNWESIYKNTNVWGNDFPSDFLDSIIPLLKPNAKVLDIGCGAGRNSVYFAKHGFKVHAMDISSTAIQRLKGELSADKSLQVKAWVGDLKDEILKDKYDLIIMYGVLNSIEQKYWNGIFNKIRSHTALGGYNSIIYFNTFSDQESVDSCQVLSLASPIQICDYYKKWNKVKFDVRTTFHQHMHRKPHTHVIERTIFRLEQSSIKKSIDSPIKVALIGPTTPITEAIAPSHNPDYIETVARKVGEHIALSGCRLVCIPDGGVAKSAFQAYSNYSPIAPAIILKPNYDELLSSRHDPDWDNKLNQSFELVSGFNWEEQAVQLAKIADVFIVVGMSCGTLIEILWTKWLNRPVFMSLDICSKLPPEVLVKLNVFELPNYISMLNMFDVWCNNSGVSNN